MKTFVKEEFISKHFGHIIMAIVSLAAVTVSIIQFKHTKNKTTFEQNIRISAMNLRADLQSRELLQRKFERRQLDKLKLFDFFLSKIDNLKTMSSEELQNYIDVLSSTFDEELVRDYLEIIETEGVVNAKIEKIKEKRSNSNDKLVTELLIPLIENLNSSEETYKKYKKKYEYKYAKEIYDYNQSNFNLLVAQKDLIPKSLLDEADMLKNHYGAWMSGYENLLGEFTSEPRQHDRFRVIYAGITFPTAAATNLKLELRRIENLKNN